MTTSEAKQAEQMLADRVERTETIAVDGGGVALTAYWTDGGQKMFYSLESVEQHIADREQAGK